MSESQHTPGPWRIMQCLPRVQEYAGQTETVIVDEDNRNILNRTGPIEEAANARLIASAPELLRVLQLVLGWAEMPPEEQPRCSLAAIIADPSSIVIAAIAKATA